MAAKLVDRPLRENSRRAPRHRNKFLMWRTLNISLETVTAEIQSAHCVGQYKAQHTFNVSLYLMNSTHNNLCLRQNLLCHSSDSQNRQLFCGHRFVAPLHFQLTKLPAHIVCYSRENMLTHNSRSWCNFCQGQQCSKYCQQISAVMG